MASEQGKPPDLALEIASEGTGHIDVGEKREFYQGLGIPEYWRFDASGEYHGARPAGDRLGCYDPATGLHIASLETERVRADTAEARVREPEAELRRVRGD